MATISSTLRMIDQFSQPIDYLISGITNTIDALESLQDQAAKPNEISEAFIDAKKNISLAKHELEKMDGLQEKLNDEVDNTKTKFLNLGNTIKTVGGLMAAYFSIQFGKDAFDQFAMFEQGMKKVATIIPGVSQETMKAMTEQIRAFRIEFGVNAEQATQGLYDSLSAGVPPGNVFDFLEIAQKAAVGGVTDLTTTVDGLTSVVNAYGDGVIDAVQVADLMFQTMKIGKTSFEEMAASLYNVVPIASSLGVGFDNVSAALATMTAQGIPTAQTTTQLRQLMVELSKAGTAASDTFKKAAGMGFKDFIAEGNNIADALMIMEQVAIQTGVGINDLFSSVEAGNAALALTGSSMDKFLSDLEAMRNSAGAAEDAFQTLRDSRATELAAMKEIISIFIEDVGQNLVPLFQGINNLLTSGFLDPFFVAVLLFVSGISYIAQVLSLLANFLSPLSPLILGVVAAIAAYVAVTKLQQIAQRDVLISTLKLIGATIKKALVDMLALGPIGLVIIAITAFMGVLVGLMTKFDWVRQGVIEAINGILNAVNWLLDMIRKLPGVGDLIGDFRLGLLDDDAFKFRSRADDIGEFEMPDMGDDIPQVELLNATELELGKIGKIGEVGKIGNPVNIAEETLRYLRDLAEREVMVSFEKLTAETKVYHEMYLAKEDAELLRSNAGKDVVNNYISVNPQVNVSNEVHSKVDLEEELRELAARTQEEIEIGLSDVGVVLP